MQKDIAICWFRQDLRLSDHPALTAAAQHAYVLPIYILDDAHAGIHKMGKASRVWLHHALEMLQQSLQGHLSYYCGNPLIILNDLIARYDISAVYWNRCYEPWRIQRDHILKQLLTDQGIRVESYNGSLLWEPWTIKKTDGTPYKVFTPFYKKGCGNAQPPRIPLPVPPLNCISDENAIPLEGLHLRPIQPWGSSMMQHWNVGEKNAHDRLAHFITESLPYYKDKRDYPAQSCTSRLSPYLHFGEISPHQVWHVIQNLTPDAHSEHFKSELAWREFSYHLLYHHPHLPTHNLQSKFDDFPWIEHKDNLAAWQRGETGIPMVDAGMRELWQTGYMHNRVRMIVGSFLVKNLRLHWHNGAQWFWDTLVDADLANNSASWQWIAGCGADAAPYFRIFNPVTQGQKFDPEGAYIRTFIPKLARLPLKYLFNPWTAPVFELQRAGVRLGYDYPYPIVDIQQSRQCALDAFKSLRRG